MKKLIIVLVLMFSIVGNALAHSADHDFIDRRNYEFYISGFQFNIFSVPSFITPVTYKAWSKAYTDYWHIRRGGFLQDVNGNLILDMDGDPIPFGVDQGIQSFAMCIGEATKSFELLGLKYKILKRDQALINYIHDKPADPCLERIYDVYFCEVEQIGAAKVTEEWAKTALGDCKKEVRLADSIYRKALIKAKGKPRVLKSEIRKGRKKLR